MSAPDVVAKWSSLTGRSRFLWTELKSNRRAAAGLLAIGIIVAVYGLGTFGDAAARLQQVYGRDLVRLHRIEAIAEQHEWPQRAQAAAAMRRLLEDRLWTATSDGLARAAMEEWVAHAGGASGLKELQVGIDLADVNEIAHVRRVTATMTARASETALAEFLVRVQRSPRLLVTKKLHVGDSTGNGGSDLFVEMVLVAYVRIGGDAGARGASAMAGE